MTATLAIASGSTGTRRTFQTLFSSPAAVAVAAVLAVDPGAAHRARDGTSGGTPDYAALVGPASSASASRGDYGERRAEGDSACAAASSSTPAGVGTCAASSARAVPGASSSPLLE